MKTRFLVALAVTVLVPLAANRVPAHAGVDVNVSFGIPIGVAVAPAPVVAAPPPFYVEERPEMVAIPGSNVYFAPNVSVDLFFYDNRWWNRRGNRWFLAATHNGPWMAVGPRAVPAAVYRVPADYRAVYIHQERVPYGQWKKSRGMRPGRHDAHDRGGRYGHRD